MVRYGIEEEEFEEEFWDDFSTSADAEPLLWEMDVNQDLFWDEIDWLWDSTDEGGAGGCEEVGRGG